MEQQSGLSGEQKSLLIALIGAVIVAGWFAVSMSIVTTLIFGLPIGAVGALIVYRTVARMSRQSPPTVGSESSLNGTQPAQKKREDARPASPTKLV